MARTRNWSRRDVIRAAGAAALGGPMVLRPSLAIAKPSRITVMAVGGSWGDAIRELIGNPYSKKYGIDVAYDQRPNAQQIAALQAMRGNPNIDTVELGSTRLGHAISLGLIAPINPKNAPNFAKVDPAHKNEYYADRYVAAWALTFNSREINRSAAESQGWNLLLDPKLKGRVAIPKFGWMGEMWMHALNLALGGDYERFDPAIEFCRKVVRENDGLVMESNDHGLKLFGSAEILAAPFWVGRTYQMQDKGIPVDFVYPRGWVPYGSGFVAVKGTGNEEWAERFIDVSLSPEVQVQVAKKFSYLPTNTEALAMVKEVPRLNIDKADMAKAQKLDYEKMYRFSDRYLERVNREVVG